MKAYKFKYDISQSVRILAIEMDGRIDSLSTDGYVNTYRVVYWINGERKATWMYEWEIC